MPKFTFDKKTMKFHPRKIGWKFILYSFVKYLLMSFMVAVGCYLLLALVFNTDREKKLMAENRRMKEECASLERKMLIVDQVVSNLDYRDHSIYRDIFSAEIPEFTGAGQDTLFVDWAQMGNRDDKELVRNTAKKAKRLEYYVNKVNYYINVTNAQLGAEGVTPTAIPSIAPLENFETLQTGASVGNRMNPFFKTFKEHNGIDLMAPVGTDVVCTADGVVKSVTKGDKGLGNRIEVAHKGGFVTTYSHLSEMNPKPGEKVRQGEVIGKVGMSGTSFASCLHYEILKNGRYQDPANYFFADLNPVTYREVMIIAKTTGQSMD